MYFFKNQAKGWGVGVEYGGVGVEYGGVRVQGMYPT